jgi:hypothetical protein
MSAYCVVRCCAGEWVRVFWRSDVPFDRVEPNFKVELLTTLLRIVEVSISNHDPETGYSN